MEYLVTSNEMRAYDTNTIEAIGIPALVLMERAALETVSCIKEILKKLEEGFLHSGIKRSSKILCVCGIGNNGGDGLCVARLLREQGYLADAVIIGNREKMTRETALQLSILEKYNISAGNQIPQENYDIIVDALFGIGLSREITGAALEAIAAINNKEAYKIAVDIPSGIDADTGKILGCAVKADETIAIAFKKRGHYLYPGTLFCGKIRIADIGITTLSFQDKTPQMYTFNGEGTSLFPARKANGNKGTFGKVLLIAGSEAMAGAALLCAESAYKAGAGMVKLVVPFAIRDSVLCKLPEALLQVYHTSREITAEEKNLFLENMDWADIIAIGPGLGKSPGTEKFLKLALCADKPLLIDADGLNMLAESVELQNQLKQRQQFTVLTPHMGEVARLLDKSISEITEDETAATIALAEKLGCTVVGKSARTYVYTPQRPVFLNTAGNDKMATAGSGDVLAGILAALLAGRIKEISHKEKNDNYSGVQNLVEAVCKGVALHATAGDLAAAKAGKAGLTASDIIAELYFLN